MNKLTHISLLFILASFLTAGWAVFFIGFFIEISFFLLSDHNAPLENLAIMKLFSLIGCVTTALLVYLPFGYIVKSHAAWLAALSVIFGHAVLFFPFEESSLAIVANSKYEMLTLIIFSSIFAHFGNKISSKKRA